jgi:Holliday junction resolvase RusA-like endonuclease
VKYNAFLSMPPPTATAQHKGSRIVYIDGRPTIMHYTKLPQRKVHDAYVRLLTADILRREDGIGREFTFTTAIAVEIDFFFQNPSNTPKRDKDKTFAKVTRPDVDNMAKGLLDCLTEVGLIQDDGLIFHLRVRKFTTGQKHVGIGITITDELDNYTLDGDMKETKDNEQV